MRNTSLIYIYISRMQSSVQAQWIELGKEVPMQESKGTQFWLREGPRRVLVFRPLQTIGNIIDGRHIKETRESFHKPLRPHSYQSLTCSGEVYLKTSELLFSPILRNRTGPRRRGTLPPKVSPSHCWEIREGCGYNLILFATSIVQLHRRHSQ